MNLAVLKEELTTDPLGVGYSGMTDAEIAASMNAPTRTRNRASMTASEVLNAVVVSEWNALTAEQKATVWNVLHIGTINPFGVEASLFVAVFGAGSETIQALAALRVESISRAQELGLEPVSVGYIIEARAYGEA